jgi:CoA:oxalate CoA-transferase
MTCATTRVSRRMPPVSPTSGRRTLSSGAWTQTLSKMEVFPITNEHRIPCAPVRDVGEVMHDTHMHERGMLEWIEHDEIGHIVVPTSPLRFHGADRVATAPGPKSG